MEYFVLITRALVIVMYVAVFIYACMTVNILGGNWTRRVTVVIFMIISGYWSTLYIYVLLSRWNLSVEGTSAIAMWTRIGHYVIAGGLWTIIGFLRTVAKRYEIVSIKKNV